MGPDSIAVLKQASLELQLASGNISPPEVLEERRNRARERASQTAGDRDLMEGMKAFVDKRESQYERPANPGS
jgi:hypothetical protein